MQFAEDSIFVAPPLLLDTKQRRFLVGIRYAVEAAGLAQRRLLTMLGRADGRSESPLAEVEHVRVFADAWALIDNVRRFQRLLWKMPGIAGFDTASNFVKGWANLKAVRDMLQHIERDFGRENLDGNYVQGTLTWIDARFRLSHGELYAAVLNAGPQGNRKAADQMFFPTSIPLDAHDDIHGVVLALGKTSVDLTELWANVVSTIKLLDEAVSAAALAKIEEQVVLHPEREERLRMRAKADQGIWLAIKVPNLGDGGTLRSD